MSTLCVRAKTGVNVVCVFLKFYALVRNRMIVRFCNDHLHGGEHMGMETQKSPRSGSFQHSAVCEISKLKHQVTKRGGKILDRAGIVCYMIQEKSDEKREREKRTTRSARSVLKKTTIFAYLHVQTN